MIMKALEKEPVERKSFNNRMNQLKQDSHARILFGTRAGWYEYTEKVIRGYARLRAAMSKVMLEPEHPHQQRRKINSLLTQPVF
jgi:hypothetical protein